MQSHQIGINLMHKENNTTKHSAKFPDEYHPKELRVKDTPSLPYTLILPYLHFYGYSYINQGKNT